MGDTDTKKCSNPSSAEEALVLNEYGTTDVKTSSERGAAKGRRRFKKIWVFLVIFVLLFLCMTALYIYQRYKTTTKEKEVKTSQPYNPTTFQPRQICKTPECFITATGQYVHLACIDS